MTVKFRSRRIFGILLAILFAVNDVLFWLLKWRGFSLMAFITSIPPIILAVAFFLKNERIHNLVTAIALFSGCLPELYWLIDQLTDRYYYYYDAIIQIIMIMVVYGLLGSAFVLHKRNKPIRIAAAIATIVLVMLFSCAGTFSYIFLILELERHAYDLGYFDVFGSVALMIILLDLMGDNPPALNKDTQKEIVISREIISVKDLLMFVEDEFKSGKISEEEYSRKRNEILNQL